MNLRYKFFSSQKTNTGKRRLILLLPFFLLTLLLVVIPLVMVIVKSFIPVEGATFADNWNFIGVLVWWKIFQSFYIALITTIIAILIAYPFAYFLSLTRNKIYRSMIILVVTAPIWTSFLVKLVGLKTFFDFAYGYQNATYGDIWTIIGLVYLYLPFMILPLYSVLSDMPRNYINASYDLGEKPIGTFFKIVVPYTKAALISGITLVFLPSLTTVAVPQFLNNSPDNSMIGDIIVDEGNLAATSPISLARASTLSLVLSMVIIGGFGLFTLGRKGVIKWWNRHKEKYE